MELLCGVAATWHRRAGKELERDHAPRFSEEGSAPRIAARELTGASVDLQAPVQPDLIEAFLCSSAALCSKACALASRTVLMGGVARPAAVACPFLGAAVLVSLPPPLIGGLRF